MSHQEARFKTGGLSLFYMAENNYTASLWPQWKLGIDTARSRSEKGWGHRLGWAYGGRQVAPGAGYQNVGLFVSQ